MINKRERIFVASCRPGRGRDDRHLPGPAAGQVVLKPKATGPTLKWPTRPSASAPADPAPAAVSAAMPFTLPVYQGGTLSLSSSAARTSHPFPPRYAAENSGARSAITATSSWRLEKQKIRAK